MLLIVVSGTREDVPGLREVVYAELDALMAEFPSQWSVMVMHGACGWDASKPDGWTMANIRGADRQADLWAGYEDGMLSVPMPADWSLGRGAGPARNLQMVNVARVYHDCGWTVRALAFPWPNSLGTRNFVRHWREVFGGYDLLKIIPVGGAT